MRSALVFLVFLVATPVMSEVAGAQHIGNEILYHTISPVLALSPALFSSVPSHELNQALTQVQHKSDAIYKLVESLGKVPFAPTITQALIRNPAIFEGLTSSQLAYNAARIAEKILPENTATPKQFSPTEYPFVASLLSAARDGLHQGETSFLEMENDILNISAFLEKIKAFKESVPQTGIKQVDIYIDGWVVAVLLFAVCIVILLIVLVVCFVQFLLARFNGGKYLFMGLYMLPQLLYTLLSAIGLTAIYLGLGYAVAQAIKLSQSADGVLGGIDKMVNEIVDGIKKSAASTLSDVVQANSQSLGQLLAAVNHLDTTIAKMEGTLAIMAAANNPSFPGAGSVVPGANTPSNPIPPVPRLPLAMQAAQPAMTHDQLAQQQQELLKQLEELGRHWRSMVGIVPPFQPAMVNGM